MHLRKDIQFGNVHVLEQTILQGTPEIIPLLNEWSFKLVIWMPLLLFLVHLSTCSCALVFFLVHLLKSSLALSWETGPTNREIPNSVKSSLAFLLLSIVVTGSDGAGQAKYGRV